MIEYKRVLIASCDSDMGWDNCWDEVVIALENNESKTHAMEFLEKKMGWKISENTCICPFCSDGVLKQDIEDEIYNEAYTPKLELVKNNDEQ